MLRNISINETIQETLNMYDKHFENRILQNPI